MNKKVTSLFKSNQRLHIPNSSEFDVREYEQLLTTQELHDLITAGTVVRVVDHGVMNVITLRGAQDTLVLVQSMEGSAVVVDIQKTFERPRAV